MTTILRILYSHYKYIVEDLSDPRTKDWFLVGSPWVVLGIIAFYLRFVYVLGPKFMERRQPYNLKKVLVIYNIMQIVINVYLLYEAILIGWFWKYKVICEPVDYSNSPDAIRAAGAVWMYYMVKIIDLFDTVFFILRKKQVQISFLHVYHHAGVTFGAWAATRYLAGGHATFLGVINSFVHVVMYSHYLWTSLKLGKPWWKKYITQLQIFQFWTILVHYSTAILTKDCAFPKWPLIIFIPQNFFMLILFSDFYYKTYIKKSPSKVDQNGVSSKTESNENGVELSNGKSKTH
ncbi:hypothetical protein KPH14_006154 [Odynerus spinipes]|uniref:Elongation of very long chain fatty acids protein n=1 Tax=Odynerus spinipes TaxID=1348599 RepID=A0AAD9RJK0_9HYME|nr:hypothetical protein KPH14_006154 [Odynerus spinipes]